MSLESGNYRIICALRRSGGKNLACVRYYDNLLLVNDYSNHSMKVTHTGGDKYIIQFTSRPDDFFGPTDNISDDNRVLSRPGKYEWSINAAGVDQWKIHVPEKDYYWCLPQGTGNESRIQLKKSEGVEGELWSFKKV
ncbi:hypothetical protein RhiJN_08039 [Ceratobasidium sp. AG-Ba]|nr:hypothetical protein RhiJN_08039 [Ceratobasidium sp. AG-Ba]QRW08821.1 hypothetical protein RhiLY_07820 [Ceratobasidium sp. AG-Ba]